MTVERPRLGAPGCSVIVLAGGGSTRFGRDKLAEPIDGRPLLAHAIEAGAAIAADVIVVLGPGDDRPELGAGIRVARDREVGGGPLVGLMAGLEAARERIAVVVGGDMPGLRPAVLTLLIERLGCGGAADELRPLDAASAPPWPSLGAVEASVLDDGGRSRPLPMAVRVGAAVAASAAAYDRGARSLHALLDGLRVDVVPAAEWRLLDPEGVTLRDIDRPGDLDLT